MAKEAAARGGSRLALSRNGALNPNAVIDGATLYRNFTCTMQLLGKRLRCQDRYGSECSRARPGMALPGTRCSHTLYAPSAGSAGRIIRERDSLKVKMRAKQLDVPLRTQLQQVLPLHHDQRPLQRLPQVDRDVALIAAAVHRQGGKQVLCANRSPRSNLSDCGWSRHTAPQSLRRHNGAPRQLP